MQILINCRSIQLGNHMSAYLREIYNKKPVIIRDEHLCLDNELQMSVYTSEIETCLQQMANRIKELCSIWDFNQSKISDAIFNDTMAYMQSLAMWTWCLNTVYDKCLNKKDIELLFTNATRSGGDYFTRQHVNHIRQKVKDTLNSIP